MPFWLSGADFRHRADAWKPQPQCQPDVQPGAPHRRRHLGKSLPSASDAIDGFDVRSAGGTGGPFFQSRTNPMIDTAAFRDRRDGGPMAATRATV
jgi:hypothetical protein